MAAYDVGFTPGLYRVRLWQGMRFYVGYDTTAGAVRCIRYVDTQTARVPFPGSVTVSTILAGTIEACPGFDIDADGRLWVDVPTDDAGSARRFISGDAGATWTELT